MSKKVRFYALAVVMLSFMFSACTRYANEGELKALEDQQAAVRKAETQLTGLRTERRNLESRLSEKQRELKAAEEENAAVQSRLQ